MKRAILTLHEKHNIEKNGLTFEYEIKVQVLKDLVELNHARYLARFFCPKSSKQPLLFCSIVRKEEWHFIYSWVNEKWIVQKMNLLLQLYITEIEQFFSYKKETGKSNRAMACC